MELTVERLIEMLKKYPMNSKVYLATKNNDGCGTCGFDYTTSEHDIRLIDLETKVIIESDD